MENGPLIGDVSIQIVMFHSYVDLPEGTTWFTQENLQCHAWNINTSHIMPFFNATFLRCNKNKNTSLSSHLFLWPGWMIGFSHVCFPCVSCFPMFSTVFLWFFYVFSYGFPWFSTVFHGLFLRFSDFPMVFPWVFLQCQLFPWFFPCLFPQICAFKTRRTAGFATGPRHRGDAAAAAGDHVGRTLEVGGLLQVGVAADVEIHAIVCLEFRPRDAKRLYYVCISI